MSALTIRTLATLLFVAGAWAAYTQNPPPARPAATQKVKDNLYLITGEGGNVAVYVTPGGVILVDDMYERNYAEVMTQVRAITNQPVRYLLNTHHHDDHAGANGKMLDAAVEVVSHRNARANTVRLGQAGPARLTYADEFALHLGGKEVRALHFGRGHTNGDAIIYFPELKTIHTGDIFLNNATATRPAQPYIDSAAGGSAIEWTHVLDETLKLDFDTVIAGHGPVSDRVGLRKWQADFVAFRDRIQGLVRSGANRAEVERVLVDEYKWPRGGLALGQLDALIAELR